MSYCRWSSNNFACDLYCYADARGGWTTHVANNRVVRDVPKVDHMLPLNDEKFLAELRVQHAFLDTAERAPIGLPYDGKTFNDPTLEDFRARLVMLREVGYNFPDYVLESVDEEIAGEKEHEADGLDMASGRPASGQ